MVYILKFEKPIGSNNPRGQAHYYVGYCDDDRLSQRLKEHQSGRGAAITAYAARQNIRFAPVLLFPRQGRAFEKMLKRMKNTPRFVSKCQTYRPEYPMVVCKPDFGRMQ